MLHTKPLNSVPYHLSEFEKPPCKFSPSFITFSLHKHSFKPLIHSPPSQRNSRNNLKVKACSSYREVEKEQKKPVSELLDEELLNRISGVEDADKALVIIAENSKKSEGVVSSSDSGLIIQAALDQNNTQLALSIYSSMKAKLCHQGARETNSSVKRWKWGRVDAHIYSLLVRGLASSFQVSDAIRILQDVVHKGDFSGEELSFGSVVRCPRCKIPLAIVRPDHGIQIASCWKCRYQYQLFSGNIVRIQTETTIETEEKNENGLSRRRWISSYIRSIVVQPPIGDAYTHNFTTDPAKMTAREGDRVTIILAAPSNVNQEAPGSKLGVAICLTNHTIGLEPVPNNMVDATATKQQLLSQYDLLQNRINGLRESAQKEVWMLARMYQLENKMEAVGQPSYRAQRRSGSLERSLTKKIELIDSYPKISSIIELEIEMSSDAVAAEHESNMENIAEQMKQIMEFKNFEETWKLQAAANDEVEMILSSQSMVT